jgi:hypothetical protein
VNKFSPGRLFEVCSIKCYQIRRPVSGRSLLQNRSDLRSSLSKYLTRRSTGKPTLPCQVLVMTSQPGYPKRIGCLSLGSSHPSCINRRSVIRCQAAENLAAEGQAAEDLVVEGQAAEGQAAEGQAAEGQAAEGQAARVLSARGMPALIVHMQDDGHPAQGREYLRSAKVPNNLLKALSRPRAFMQRWQNKENPSCFFQLDWRDRASGRQARLEPDLGQQVKVM